MTCSRCAPFFGKGMRRLAFDTTADEPRCAFDDDGRFRALSEGMSPVNWDCQTLAAFRSHPCAIETGSEDQTLLVVPFSGEFVVLGFYKHRGHVETALYVHEYIAEPLTLTTAERLLAEVTP